MATYVYRQETKCLTQQVMNQLYFLFFNPQKNVDGERTEQHGKELRSKL